jgi:DNA-binding Lrp family transcriptional regulator
MAVRQTLYDIGFTYTCSQMRTTIPLRMEILALLSDSGSPLSLAQIQQKLGKVSKSAVLRWLQSMVEDQVIVRIDDSYALIDKAEYSVSRDIVTLSSMKAMVSSGSRGSSATLYGENFKEKIDPGKFKSLTDEFIDNIVKLAHPSLQSIEKAAKTVDAAKLVGMKFAVVVNFDGTKSLAASGGDLKDLTKKAIQLLSKYGPMGLDEIAEQLKISAIEAYQATSPLIPALAEREADGRIKLLIKVAE